MKLISFPKIFFSFFILFSLIISTSQFSIDPTNRFILDNYGRYSIFHGGNVVVKLPPYLPTLDKFDYQYSLNTPLDLETMKRLGFNSVRLGVIWEAVEKAPGVYDMDYLDQVEKIINKLGENGVYTMVDAHQDVFARQFCGEGVPYFYVNEMGYDKKCDASILTRLLDLVGVCKTIEDFNFRSMKMAYLLLKIALPIISKITISSQDLAQLIETFMKIEQISKINLSNFGKPLLLNLKEINMY